MKPNTVDYVLSLRACTTLRRLLGEDAGKWTPYELRGPLRNLATANGFSSPEACLLAQPNCGKRTAQEILDWGGFNLPVELPETPSMKKPKDVDHVLGVRAYGVLRQLYNDDIGRWTAKELRDRLKTSSALHRSGSPKRLLLDQPNCGRHTAKEILDWCFGPMPKPIAVPHLPVAFFLRTEDIPNPVIVEQLMDGARRATAVYSASDSLRKSADILPAGLLLLVGAHTRGHKVVMQVDDDEPVVVRPVDIQVAGIGIFASAMGKMAGDLMNRIASKPPVALKPPTPTAKDYTLADELAPVAARGGAGGIAADRQMALPAPSASQGGVTGRSPRRKRRKATSKRP